MFNPLSKKFKQFSIWFATALLAAGCTVNGSLGGLFSYQKVIEKGSPALIKRTEVPVCELAMTEKPVVYAINGENLKNCIANLNNTLVYIWQPNCKSKFCLPLNYVQSVCNKNNTDLFVVAEYYDSTKMMINYPLNRPIFGIDGKYYKSSLTEKYMKRFLTDLLGETATNNRTRFYFFQEGKLADTASDLKRIVFSNNRAQQP